MPHIPIPPTQFKGKGYTNLTGKIVNTNTNGVVNITQPNSNVAQQIKDVAEQEARMVLDEWMKQHKDLFDSTERKLRIKNVQKLIGMEYDSRLRVIGVLEENKYYEFTLGNDLLNQTESILLHRRQTDSGHYIMEYKGKTLWLTIDEIDMPEKIIICMNTI
jgi:hypothetical protein